MMNGKKFLKTNIFSLYLSNLRNRRMEKKLNYQKELCRGTLKQIMKVRGLRTISLANYYEWCKENNIAYNLNACPVHSLKIDIQDGYLNAYDFNKNSKRCGEKLENASADVYTNALNEVNSILANESNIPTKVKRNILVRMAR